MALRNIIGFDHIPVNDSVDWRTYGIPGLDWWSGTRATYRATKDANGYMQVNTWNTNIDTILQITEGNGFPAGTKKIWIGFNYKILVAAPAATLANMMLHMDTLLDPATNPARAYISLMLANELPGYAVNKEYHIDLCLNVESGIIERYVDNVKLSDAVAPAGLVKSNLAARKFILCPFLSDNSQTNSRYGVRDIFVYDELDEGDGVINRLGKQRVAQIAVDSVEGTDWTTTSANLKEGLTLPLASALPGCQGPLVPTDLSIKPALLAMAAGETITGVQFTTSMINSTTDSIGVSAKLQTEDGEVAGLTVTPVTNAQQYNRRMGTFGRDGKGRPWTAAHLAASKVVLRQVNA